MRHFTLIAILFSIGSCANKDTVNDRIQGIWVLDSTQIYGHGLTKTDKTQNEYWEFNKHNNIVYFSKDTIKFVQFYKIQNQSITVYENQKSDSIATYNIRKLNATSLILNIEFLDNSAGTWYLTKAKNQNLKQELFSERQINNADNNSTKSPAIKGDAKDEDISSNITEDDTTRNSDGLYIPLSLVRTVIGQWESEPVTFAQDKSLNMKAIFNYTLNDDASGNLKIKILVNETNTQEEVTLFFHIYPWGIVNNRNNTNMFYLSLDKGVSRNSTIKNKTLENSIKSELLTLIEKSKGFSAVISNINKNTIEIQEIEPKGIYPNKLTRVP